jgi:hypothetical protein
MIRGNTGKDGLTEEMNAQDDALATLVAENPNSELAVSLRTLKTSSGAATNRALPASMFERGVRVIQGGTDHAFTRRVIETSKPPTQRDYFDRSRSGTWLK